MSEASEIVTASTCVSSDELVTSDPPALAAAALLAPLKTGSGTPSPRSDGMASSDDAKLDEEASSGFEGPEKVLELEFSIIKGPAAGLRTLSRAQWDAVLEDAKCSILCSMSNDQFDSYVLSESSLFVYPHTAILKTCGTTTLLRCISRLVGYTSEIGMELEWVGYTRKNFTFPHKQLFPHTSPEDEVRYLRSLFDFNIEAFVLGPITGDHWYVIIADHSNRPAETSTDRTLDLMMFDLDPEVAANFIGTPEGVDREVHRSVTVKAGIHTIMPDATIQEWAFSPCGYSCNAQLADAYHTIHVTPESHCSYASFETNIKLPAYGPIISTVLKLFKPKRFTLTMFADGEGISIMKESPYPNSYDAVDPEYMYVLSSRAHAEAGDYRSFLGNYRLKRRDEASSPLAILRASSFNAFFPMKTPSPPV